MRSKEAHSLIHASKENYPRVLFVREQNVMSQIWHNVKKSERLVDIFQHDSFEI